MGNDIEQQQIIPMSHRCCMLPDCEMSGVVSVHRLKSFFLLCRVPLERASEAYKALLTRQNIGKVLVLPGQGPSRL